MKQMKHVIIGVGAAGISAAKTIRKHRSGDEIVIISKDSAVYSRCMLHKYIGGGRSEAALSFIPDDFFETNNIRWLSGVTVTGVDSKKKLVSFDGGSESYGRLLIATGARSVIPPVGGLSGAENVFGLRGLEDAKAIREYAARTDNIVIIGAGLVGLDAAYGLVEMGKKPTIVDMAGSILTMNLDVRAASVYQAKFEEAGCSFRLGRKISGTVNDASGNVTAITLDNGEQLPCGLVIAAAGVRPAVEFLADSGITCGQGGAVSVDKYLAASAEGVYAAGDAAGLSGIWPSAVRQGKIAALNMCEEHVEYSDAFSAKNTVNFFGITSLSAGQMKPSDGDLEYCREARGGYEKYILRDGVPVGVVLQGDISYSGLWQYMIKNKIKAAAVSKPVWKLSFADFYGMRPNGEYKWP